MVDALDSETLSTPLSWAARYGHQKLVAFLLERGAATSLAEDQPGTTPLYWAQHQGYSQITRMLEERGAEL